MDQDLLATKVCRHGTITYLRTDSFIGRSLDLYGEWGEGEIILFRRLLKPGNVVIDVGANVGTHTLALAKLVGPTGSVYSFEPQQEIYDILRTNIVANGLTNVTAYCAGAGAADGSCHIPKVDYGKTNNFGLVAVGDGEIEVPQMTIDALQLQKLDLIKIDVEGTEADVLTGATATIARSKPILYVENNNAAKCKALVALIRSLNYRLWWHLSAYYNELNFAGNPHNVWPGRYDPYVVCLPVECPVPPWPLDEILDD